VALHELTGVTQTMERRLDDLRSQLPDLVRDAVRDALPASLSDDELQWVRLAIQREAQSIKLRQAIIEKTITSLIWSAVVGAGLVMLDYLRSHGLKL